MEVNQWTCVRAPSEEMPVLLALAAVRTPPLWGPGGSQKDAATAEAAAGQREGGSSLAWLRSMPGLYASGRPLLLSPHTTMGKLRHKLPPISLAI